MGINKINIKNNGDSMNGHLSVQTHDRVSQHDRIFQPYPKYKNSNIPWLGEIPEHWKTTYIKGITKTYSEKGKPELELLSVYRDYGVIKKSSRDDNHNKPGMDLSSYKVVYPNTLVLNKMKTWSGSLGVSNYLGIVSPAYITCKIDLEQVEIKYLNYLLRCKNYVFEYNRLSYGVRPSQWDMRYQEFKSIPIFLPPKEEQSVIARFLDYKLAKINRFIRKKKQLITLLNEQKAAIINQAVTKGLDPNVKMKDSGIEWLGEIPEHWEVRKLKTIVSKKITDGPHETPEFVEKGIPFISAEAINSDGSISFENRRADISKELDQIYSLKCKPQRDDVFIVKSGSTTGKIGFVNTDLDFNIWSPLALVRSKKELITGEYTFRTLQSPYFQSQVQTKWSFGTQPNIGMGVLENLYVIVPPKSEQTQILNFISEEIEPIFLTISKIEKELALTEEYKTALIAEAVTGKIDVRGYEVPEIMEEETFDELQEELSMVAEDGEAYQDIIE